MKTLQTLSQQALICIRLSARLCLIMTDTFCFCCSFPSYACFAPSGDPPVVASNSLSAHSLSSFNSRP